MHGGKSTGAPKGNQNATVHGLRAKYVKIEDLEKVLPDPIKRMQVLASLMTNRAMAAHELTVNHPECDTDAFDDRIARAVRTAARATSVELAAMKVRAEGDSDEGMTSDDTFIAPDEPIPEKPIL
jgi:hypothetical protein